MSDTISIKARIIAHVMDLLQETTRTAGIRKITETNDLTLDEPMRPALQVWYSPELLTEKDQRGRTYHFDLVVKILVEGQSDLLTKIKTIVPEVQRILEGDLQLNGLANIVDGGSETPYLSEVGKPLGGALVAYTIQYRRLLGNPYTTY